MTTKTTPKADNPRPSSATRILEVLTEKPGATAAEIAEITSFGRSTISKELATLERLGMASRATGERQGGRRAADRWSPVQTNERLRPGELDDLVMTHMRTLKEPAGPVAVSRALGRSSGAVAKFMKRLAKAGELKLVDSKPRRYRPVKSEVRA